MTYYSRNPEMALTSKSTPSRMAVVSSSRDLSSPHLPGVEDRVEAFPRPRGGQRDDQAGLATSPTNVASMARSGNFWAARRDR
jgi:hypothetical protein